MKITRLIGTVGALILGATAAAGVASPAHAEDDCKTVTAEIVNRPDSGVGGTWAYDTFTRTATVCQTDPGAYEVDGAADGTFAAIEGTTPPSGTGDPLAAGVEGTFTGTWSASLTGSADWASWNSPGG